MSAKAETKEAIKNILIDVAPFLDEKQRRI